MVDMFPWAAILKHAPAILAAADALRARSTRYDAGDPSRDVNVRLAELEAESRAAAQLAQELAQQLNALIVAHDSAVRAARRSLAIAIAALVVGLAGVVLAIVS